MKRLKKNYLIMKIILMIIKKDQKAQKTFYEYQKNEISKITKEKEKLSKMQSETEKVQNKLIKIIIL